MMICNSSCGGVPSHRKHARRFLDVGAPTSWQKVVSRGAGISETPCSTSLDAKNRKLDFMVNLNPESTMRAVVAVRNKRWDSFVLCHAHAVQAKSNGWEVLEDVSDEHYEQPQNECDACRDERVLEL